MDPILTLGLSAIVFGVLILIIVGFLYHCLLSILECIGNVVTRVEPPKSDPSTLSIDI